MVKKDNNINTGRGKRIATALNRSKQYNTTKEREDAIVDVLADLRHLCDQKGWDFADLDRIAHDHYTAEVKRK